MAGVCLRYNHVEQLDQEDVLLLLLQFAEDGDFSEQSLLLKLITSHVLVELDQDGSAGLFVDGLRLEQAELLLILGRAVAIAQLYLL